MFILFILDFTSTVQSLAINLGLAEYNLVAFLKRKLTTL